MLLLVGHHTQATTTSKAGFSHRTTVIVAVVMGKTESYQEHDTLDRLPSGATIAPETTLLR